MEVGAAGGATQGSAATSTPTSGSDPFQGFDKDFFLKLFVSQLQGQTPFDVVETKDFVTQMAQFSSVESTLQMRASLEALAMQQSLTTASSLIGRQVESVDADGQPIVGVVDQVTVTGGNVYLQVGGTQVSINDIRGVLPAA